PNDPALRPPEKDLVNNFRAALANIKLETCSTCFECAFDISLKGGRECGRCRADKGDPVKKWSVENKVHPSHEVPACLKGLTEIEEMLIARVKPIMQIRYTKG
ncbi:uncharacterized protein C8R40DRAFT_1028588, partial [Lentinula edodes]